MTSPNADNEPAGQRRANVPRQDGSGADATPADVRPAPSDRVDARRYEYAETALGGADSVEKTSYVVGEGTEPEGAPRASVIARTSTGGGVNITAWVIGAVAAIIAAIYMLGIFR